ncbi:YdcH family protein [uncultured Phenylobacterium sp.]|uniref:YdcH family protein n=1 Tax=uncultured Phenylobacterium sp. TaxID=349273 RepID=UPI0025CE5A62|nr:YdcH family protein [uncultured Phenylobacterium sp.]
MNHHRIWRLRNLHRELKRLIREEDRRAIPDALILRDLKRRKLQVKDQLFMAEAGLVPVTTRVGHG